jgi:hypothetical protein
VHSVTQNVAVRVGEQAEHEAGREEERDQQLGHGSVLMT